MVQLRGISVNAISQLDADRLPESSIARAFGSGGAIAACYMPIRPGAQLWFEYSIDGPHPPQAAYFFKMFLNGQVVISWDCTAKHDYYGKLVYSLQVTKSAIADKLTIAQKSITFASTDSYHSPNFDNDCVEIRVHRIEHRRRLRALTEDDAPQILPQSNTAVRVVDNGLIEPGRPARRYQYQLLDPQDEPYAKFRFYFRTQKYLERHRIFDIGQSSPLTSFVTSTNNYLDALTSPSRRGREFRLGDATPPVTPCKSIASRNTSRSSLSPARGAARLSTQTCSPLRGTIKDSIEDLSSTVPQSPQSPRRFTLPTRQEHVPPSPPRATSPLLPEPLRVPRQDRVAKLSSVLDSPTPNPSASQPLSSTRRLIHHFPSRKPPVPSHQRHKPTLDDADGALFGPNRGLGLGPALDHDPNREHERKLCRPLSPFTPSGFLRRLVSCPTPNTASTSPPTPTPTPISSSTGTQDTPELGQLIEPRGAGERTQTPIWMTRGRRGGGRGLLTNLLGRGGRRAVV